METEETAGGDAALDPQVKEWAARRVADVRSRELEHSLKVGPDKPLGQRGFRGAWHMLCAIAWNWRNMGGTESLIVDNGGGGYWLYVWKVDALERVLTKHAKTLITNGWPTDPRLFVQWLRDHIARPGSPLWDAIADCYGDLTNPGRTDILPDVDPMTLLEAMLNEGMIDPVWHYIEKYAEMDRKNGAGTTPRTSVPVQELAEQPGPVGVASPDHLTWYEYLDLYADTGDGQHLGPYSDWWATDQSWRFRRSDGIVTPPLDGDLPPEERIQWYMALADYYLRLGQEPDWLVVPDDGDPVLLMGDDYITDRRMRDRFSTRVVDWNALTEFAGGERGAMEHAIVGRAMRDVARSAEAPPSRRGPQLAIAGVVALGIAGAAALGAWLFVT
jgi:hypothetical protein